MIITTTKLNSIPKLQYNNFTLGDEVYFRHEGLNLFGILYDIDERTATFEVAVKLEQYNRYAVIENIKEIFSISNPKERPYVFQVVTDNIAAIFASQIEIYGDSTLNDIGLDSLDLMEIISKVEIDIDRDIDISNISLSHTVDELVDIIYNAQLTTTQ